MEFTAKMISDLVGGVIEGNPDVIIRQPAKIEEATTGTITFLANMKYEAFAYTTAASALLVSLDFEPKQPIAATLIRVEHVYETVRILLEQFSKTQNPKVSASHSANSTAFIHDTATIGENTSIGTFSCVEQNVKIGNDCTIAPQVFIGEGAEIGENVTIFAGAKIHRGCKIGNNCVIHSNAVIGGDGFGFVPQKDGSFKKIPQVGIVILEENVEVGSNTTIDRATMGATTIKAGVKLDNLVMVAHNVVIDENTGIAAQTGIAGSAKIGKNCMIAGQVGIGGHISVPDRSILLGQCGVTRTLKKPNTTWNGTPAFEVRSFLKSQAYFKKLPEMEQRIRDLEKIIKTLHSKLSE